MDKLLTAEEVAAYLNISIRTVYENKEKLGGFYPLGIKVLRFKRGYIDGYLERQTTEGLGVQLQVSRESVRRQGLQNKESRNNSKGRKKDRNIRKATDQSKVNLLQR